MGGIDCVTAEKRSGKLTFFPWQFVNNRSDFLYFEFGECVGSIRGPLVANRACMAPNARAERPQALSR